jgi:hypothetical protein
VLLGEVAVGDRGHAGDRATLGEDFELLPFVRLIPQRMRHIAHAVQAQQAVVRDLRDGEPGAVDAARHDTLWRARSLAQHEIASGIGFPRAARELVECGNERRCGAHLEPHRCVEGHPRGNGGPLGGKRGGREYRNGEGGAHQHGL